ncbi:MAG: EamA family transporter [Vicinamibacterales bacterium]
MTTSSEPGAARPAYAALAVVCVVWGTTYLAIRIALETVPPMLMAGIRWVVAGLIVMLALALKGQRPPAPGQWPALAVIGLLMTSFGNGAVVWAEQTVSSGVAALLVAAVPFWMVGIERVMPDAAPVGGRRVLGLVVGFAGVILLVWPELTHPSGGSVYGILATQLACLGWAIGSAYSRRRNPGENVLASASVQMVAGGAALLAVGLAIGELPRLAFNTRTSAAVAYLVVAGSIGAFTAYLYALRHLPVTTVSIYAYINPVIAVALGSVVLGEPFSPRLVLAGSVVLVATMLVKKG